MIRHVLAGSLVVAACGGEADAPIASRTPSAVGGAPAVGGGAAVGGGSGGGITGTGGTQVVGGSGGGSSPKGGAAGKAAAAGKSGAGGKAGSSGKGGASGNGGATAGAGGAGSASTGGSGMSGGSGGTSGSGGGDTGGTAGTTGVAGGSGGTSGQGGGGTTGAGGGCTITDDVSGEPEAVAPANEVTSIEVDDTSVYWGAVDGVFAAPKNGSGPVRTLLSQPGWYLYAALVETDYVHAAALSFNGNGVSVQTYPAPAGVVRVPRSSAASPEVVTTIKIPWGPFLKVGETLYFTDAFRVVLSDGSYGIFDPAMVAEPTIYVGSRVATDGSRLYWSISRHHQSIDPSMPLPDETHLRSLDPAGPTFTDLDKNNAPLEDPIPAVAANAKHSCFGVSCQCVDNASGAVLPKLGWKACNVLMRVDDVHVYTAEAYPDTCQEILRTPVLGGPTEVVHAAPTPLYGLAIDDAYVYFFDESQGMIMRKHK